MLNSIKFHKQIFYWQHIFLNLQESESLGNKSRHYCLCVCVSTCLYNESAHVVGAAVCGAQFSGGKKTDECAELG